MNTLEKSPINLELYGDSDHLQGLMIKIKGRTILFDLPIDLSTIQFFIPQIHSNEFSNFPYGIQNNKIDIQYIQQIPFIHDQYKILIPDFTNIDIELIDYIFISNIDSYIALIYFMRQYKSRFNGYIYMTDMTLNFGELYSTFILNELNSSEDHFIDENKSTDIIHNLFHLSIPYHSKEWQSIYSHEDLQVHDLIHTLSYNQVIHCSNGLEISSVPAGGEIGASNWIIRDEYGTIVFEYLSKLSGKGYYSWLSYNPSLYIPVEIIYISHIEEKNKYISQTLDSIQSNEKSLIQSLPDFFNVLNQNLHNRTHTYIPCNIRVIYDLISLIYNELSKDRYSKYTLILFDPYHISNIYETNIEYMKSSIHENVSMGLPPFSFLNSPVFIKINSLTELPKYMTSPIILFDITYSLKNRSSLSILNYLQPYNYSMIYIDDHKSPESSLSLFTHYNRTIYFYYLSTYCLIEEILHIISIQKPKQCFIPNSYKPLFSNPSSSLVLLKSNQIYTSDPILYTTIPIIVKPIKQSSLYSSNESTMIAGYFEHFSSPRIFIETPTQNHTPHFISTFSPYIQHQIQEDQIKNQLDTIGIHDLEIINEIESNKELLYECKWLYMSYHELKTLDGTQFLNDFKVFYTKQYQFYILFYKNQIQFYFNNEINESLMNSIIDSIQSLIE